MILVALGSNRSGRWGPPVLTLERAVRELGEAGLTLRAVSPIYRTAPLGSGRQADYANAVAALDTAMPPGALLRRLKRLERAAGGRSARPWGPRALDLDILDYKGRVRGWRGRAPSPGGGARGAPVLPHPRLHVRPFVLRPLLDVAPRWRHPVLKQSARHLWRRVQTSRAGRVLRKVS